MGGALLHYHIMSMKRFFITMSVLVLSVTPVHAQETQEFVLDGVDVFANGQLLSLDELELHIRPGTISESTTAQLRSFEGKKRALPQRYRTNKTVYRYTLDADLRQPLIARMGIDGDGSSRRRLFYRSNANAPWQRLRTVTYSEGAYVQAELPAASGEVVLGVHSFKKEVPLKKSNYRSFGATPYSVAAAVVDMQSGKFLYRQRAGEQRAVASLTKLATSLVFLETDPNLDSLVSYSGSSDRGGAIVVLNNGEQLTLKQVLMGVLIPSANNMAVTLSKSTPLSESQFIARMNSRVKELGLKKTHFDEPTGLDSDNVSSAGNIARLARYAFTSYPDLYQEAGRMKQYDFTLSGSGGSVSLHTTNKFNGRDVYDVVAFKTGYLPDSAGRTLALQVRERASGHEIIVVLLGNPTYNTIFAEALELTEWTFQNWEFHNW